MPGERTGVVTVLGLAAALSVAGLAIELPGLVKAVILGLAIGLLMRGLQQSRRRPGHHDHHPRA